jgi:predicted nucleotidyltransferase
MMNQKIADYFKTQPIERAWLFGSFARGEETPISDVDMREPARDRDEIEGL